ncbi:hypothetical protein [Sinorhizobium meliloti]|uniref:hypothetical protein n=1 Tax=Rhizobium meliloti TaxID=382 RepID=UPI00030C067D|nr:hypothetical protein [Sinorhizobium meliloti]
MQDRDDHALPEQSASSEENTGLETGKKTIAKRRKSVGVIRDADPGRLWNISAEGGCHFDKPDAASPSPKKYRQAALDDISKVTPSALRPLRQSEPAER